MFPSDIAPFGCLHALQRLTKLEVHVEPDQIYSKLMDIQSPLFKNQYFEPFSLFQCVNIA